MALPEDYRQFLLEVGSGGAGPYYGVFTLAKERKGWRWRGDGGDMTTDLRTPFPHTRAWNLKPADTPLGDCPDYETLGEEFDEAYEAWDEAWAGLYWKPELTAGAIRPTPPSAHRA